MENNDVFFLDPTCFTSLDELRDALSVLDELSENNARLIVYVPTRIRSAIEFNLDRKLKELSNLAEQWITLDISNNIKRLNEEEKLQYRELIIYFLNKYKPKSAGSLVGDIRKLGTQSIYRDAVIEKYGSIIGDTVFEMLAVSSEKNAKIIGFGDKTTSLVSDLNIPTIEGKSGFKEKLRKRKKIVLPLKIALFSMTTAPITLFVQQLQIENILLSVILSSIGSTGLFIIGDG